MNTLDDSLDHAHGFHAGDHVALLEDDWSMVGLQLIVVDAEPVPGSSQCLIQAGRDTVTVSRARLRHI